MRISLNTQTKYEINTVFQSLGCWILNRGLPYSKPKCGAKADPAFYPSEVDKLKFLGMWQIKKTLSPHYDFAARRQEDPFCVSIKVFEFTTSFSGIRFVSTAYKRHRSDLCQKCNQKNEYINKNGANFYVHELPRISPGKMRNIKYIFSLEKVIQRLETLASNFLSGSSNTTKKFRPKFFGHSFVVLQKNFECLICVGVFCRNKQRLLAVNYFFVFCKSIDWFLYDDDFGV